MFNWLKSLREKRETNRPDEYILIHEDDYLRRCKNIYKYEMYSTNEKKLLEAIIDNLENSVGIRMELDLVNTELRRVYDGRFWGEKIGLMYTNLQKIYNPICLLTDEDTKNIQACLKYKDDDNLGELCNVYQPLKFWNDIGLKYNNFSQTTIKNFDALNVAAKHTMLTALNCHRISYLSSFIDDLEELLNDLPEIINYHYEVPYNKNFLINMLYNYNLKAVRLYKKALSNPKTYSDISEDNDEAKKVISFLEIAKEKGYKTTYIPEEIYNTLFKKY